MFQAGLIGVQVLWTIKAEYALRKRKTDPSVMRKTNEYFLDLLNEFIELTVKDLTKLQRTHFETMITIHVHQRCVNVNHIIKIVVRYMRTSHRFQLTGTFSMICVA